MGRRLNIWDFDDTLAWSYQAVKRFMDQNPDIEKWKWWHDPDLSTEAVLETLPIISMWKKVERTPGEHWILSGRVRKPIMEWLKIWRDHPEIGRTVRKIDKVISTSGQATKHIETAIKKSRIVQHALTVYDEIHIYDDRHMNLDSMAALSPRIKPHYVQNGRILAASETTFDDKTYQLLTQAQQTIQGLENISDTRTFQEVLRSTVGVFKRMQKDMVDTMSTMDILEYVSQQIARNKVSFEMPLADLAKELDSHHQVEVTFSLEDKLSDFHGHSLPKVYRAAHTLALNTEVVFDKLQTPFICRTMNLTYGEGRMPDGFVALIWKVE